MSMKEVDDKIKYRAKATDKRIHKLMENLSQRGVKQSISSSEDTLELFAKTLESLPKNSFEVSSDIDYKAMAKRVYNIVKTFNIKPARSYEKYAEYFIQDDLKAIESDWKEVDNDLWIAFMSQSLESLKHKKIIE